MKRYIEVTRTATYAITVEAPDGATKQQIESFLDGEKLDFIGNEIRRDTDVTVESEHQGDVILDLAWDDAGNLKMVVPQLC